MPQLNYHNSQKVSKADFVLQNLGFALRSPFDSLVTRELKRFVVAGKSRRDSSSSPRATCSAWIAPEEEHHTSQRESRTTDFKVGSIS